MKSRLTELRSAARAMVEVINSEVLKPPTTVMVDGDDDRWALAEMPDGTWKLYENTGRVSDQGDERIWLEVDHLPSCAAAVDAKADQAMHAIARAIRRAAER